MLVSFPPLLSLYVLTEGRIQTVAGMLLLNQSAEQAFVTLANMLNRPLPLAFFTQDDGAVTPPPVRQFPHSSID